MHFGQIQDDVEFVCYD